MFEDWRLTPTMMWILGFWLVMCCFGSYVSGDLWGVLEMFGWGVFYSGIQECESYEVFDYEYLGERI